MCERSPTTCCAEALGWRTWAASQQRGLHATAFEGDPEPDGGGRFHAALREGGVSELQEAFERGAADVVAGRGRDLMAAVSLRGRGRDAGARWATRSAAWTCPQGGVGLPPAGHLAGQHGRGARPRQPAGHVVSHEGAAEWIGKAHRPRDAPRRSRSACAGTRTSGLYMANFDRWSEEADFIFGYDSQPGGQAGSLEADDWERLERRPRHVPRARHGAGGMT